MPRRDTRQVIYRFAVGSLSCALISDEDREAQQDALTKISRVLCDERPTRS
jgi:hypothetical protein